MDRPGFTPVTRGGTTEFAVRWFTPPSRGGKLGFEGDGVSKARGGNCTAGAGPRGQSADSSVRKSKIDVSMCMTFCQGNTVGSGRVALPR
jgi:hypothetical protein